MAAPINNTFWKNRSTHGRDKLFATSEDLLQAAYEYFEWCDDNPWYKVDFKGKDLEQVEIPTTRPYTLSGLCLYLGCSQNYFRQFKSSPPENAEDFLTVISRIEQIIETQQFEGATVGAFNANIISRKLGLVDKTAIDVKGKTYKVDFKND